MQIIQRQLQVIFTQKIVTQTQQQRDTFSHSLKLIAQQPYWYCLVLAKVSMATAGTPFFLKEAWATGAFKATRTKTAGHQSTLHVKLKLCHACINILKMHATRDF